MEGYSFEVFAVLLWIPVTLRCFLVITCGVFKLQWTSWHCSSNTPSPMSEFVHFWHDPRVCGVDVCYGWPSGRFDDVTHRWTYRCGSALRSSHSTNTSCSCSTPSCPEPTGEYLTVCPVRAPSWIFCGTVTASVGLVTPTENWPMLRQLSVSARVRRLLIGEEMCVFVWSAIIQGGHKPGKPGILRDFSERGKLREFCATSGKNCNKQSSLSTSFKYLCKTAVDWVTG